MVYGLGYFIFFPHKLHAGVEYHGTHPFKKYCDKISYLSFVVADISFSLTQKRWGNMLTLKAWEGGSWGGIFLKLYTGFKED